MTDSSITSNSRAHLTGMFMLLCLLLSLSTTGRAQVGPTPTPLLSTPSASVTPSFSPTPTPSTTPTSGATAIPLADIADNLVNTQSAIDGVTSGILKDTTAPEVEVILQDLLGQINADGPIANRKLNQNPTIAELDQLKRDWQNIGKSLSAINVRLKSSTGNAEAGMDRLTSLIESWRLTESGGDSGSNLPAELLIRVQKVVAHLETCRSQVSQVRDRCLILMTRVSEQDARVQSVLNRISQARAESARQILFHDSSPIWKQDFSQLRPGVVVEQTWEVLSSQLGELSHYSSRNGQRFLMHFLAFCIIYLMISWTLNRVRSWAEQEPALQRTAEVFQTPWESALVLTVGVASWFHPQPPMLLQVCFNTVAILPAALVLRRILSPELRPTLYSMVLLFFTDQLRTLTLPQVLLTRLIFTVELSSILIFLLWRIRHDRLRKSTEVWRPRIRLMAGIAFLSAWLAVNLGYMGLGYLIGEASLNSLYLAMVLYCVVLLADGVLLLMLRTRPLSLLASVQTYPELYASRLQWTSRFLMSLYWGSHVLDYAQLTPPFVSLIKSIFTEELKLGALSLSLGGLLGLVCCLWIPLQISRFFRFILVVDISPKLALTSGASYTLSTLIHYTLLVIGGIIGIAALNVDLTKFTIVASALGVGIGFGLQNIVNNFVSGVILLFERPVEVGHVIEVSGNTGVLQSIGLRASVLKTADGSEIIVPNGELLSSRVTNWTFSDRNRLVKIDVGVGYGSSPQQVQQILLGIVRDHPEVLTDPPSEVLFLDMGESSLDFQLRCWIPHFERGVAIRSELMTLIYEALNEAGIEIPFPQRTLHFDPTDLPKKS